MLCDRDKDLGTRMFGDPFLEYRAKVGLRLRLVAGVSPSIHISRKYGNASAPCSVNNQLRMLVGNKNQQSVTSRALKLTATRSSRRSVKIRRYSNLTAVETSVRLSSLAMALIVLPAELVCCRCRGSAQMHERSSVCGRLLSSSQGPTRDTGEAIHRRPAYGPADQTRGGRNGEVPVPVHRRRDGGHH